MAPRAHREPAWPRERRTSPPALRGAPGAKGDRLRIRWTPPGAPDGRNSSIPAELCSHSCTTPACILPAHDLRTGSGRCDAPRRLTMASLLLLLAGLHAHGLRNHQPARDEGCNIRANMMQPRRCRRFILRQLPCQLVAPPLQMIVSAPPLSTSLLHQRRWRAVE